MTKARPFRDDSALVGDPAVAVALLTLRPDVWYRGPVGLLDELYVAPELRRRGIGSALLKAAEAMTRERAGELLEINVDGEDTDARRFYERHGYSNTSPARGQLLYYYRELTGQPNVPRLGNTVKPGSDVSGEIE